MWKLFKTFYGFLWQKRLLFLTFLFFVVIGSIISSVAPLFYRSIINAVQANKADDAIKLIAFYIAMQFSGLIINGISFMLGDKVQIESASNARKSVFSHIQDLDFAFHTSKSTGSLISTIKRGDGAFFSLFHAIHFRIMDVLIGFLFILYFFFQLHISVGIIILISFVLSLVCARFALVRNLSTRRKFNDDEDEVSSVIVDNMIGFETVKLFAKEKWERTRLDKKYEAWKKSLWNYGMSFRLLDFSVGTVVNLSVFSLLYFVLQQYSNLRLSIGDFVLVFGFISLFYPRLFDLIWGFREIAKHFADLERYFAILDQQIKVKDPKVPAGVSDIAGEIKFKNVTFSYHKRRPSLKNFTVTIRQGQSIALVGRSGAGKTTFVKLLMRFYNVDQGSITIDGINLADFTKSQLRSFMGVVPQEPVLFNNTIAYNIAYGQDNLNIEEIKAAAQMAHLDKFIESLPEGYQTHVGERGIRLSGGQKQRLAIARMILANPKIVIFDEATSHLDSESEALIQEAFWKAAKNKTTIIIAHRLSTVMRADKILVIEKGRIAESGSHGELLNKRKSLYKHFWKLQSLDY